MKNILSIYKRDLKNMVTNWVALVVMLGLVILPSLYAWFNIKSSWDPYGNTSGVAVAVVNKDKGAEFRGHSVNVGKEVVEKLKNNKNIGWKFVSEAVAENGVKHGKFYASVIIPQDFSEKIITVADDKPVKPELVYSVNEKKNAVVPKITDKGVSSVQQEIDKTFVQTVDGTIFDMFNKFGVELENSKPTVKKTMEMIFEVDRRMPQVNKDVDELYSGAITLEDFVKKVQGDIPMIDDTVKQASQVVVKGQDFMVKAREYFEKVAPLMKKELQIARTMVSTAQGQVAIAIDKLPEDSKTAREMLVQAKGGISEASNALDNIIKMLKSMDEAASNKNVENLIDGLSRMQSSLNQQAGLIDKAVSAIDNGTQPAMDTLKQVKEKAKDVVSNLDEVTARYDTSIVPSIRESMDKMLLVADNTLKLLQDASKELPQVKEMLEKAHGGTEKGISEIKQVKEKLPSAEKSLHETANKLRSLNDEADLDDIIGLLKNDSKKDGEFMADPVNIKKNRIFPIPNYGSAMTPFFTTLSLWVGALILVSILSMEVNRKTKLKSYEIYFGRYLTFMTLAMLQALVVTLGDIFLLKAYVVNPVVFVTFGMFISVVFSLVVYTLVSIFGNVGKAMSVILLVLQISASGGTFPIEVTPLFFQRLNPFLPFTYAISGMREAVAGVLWADLAYDAGVLAIYIFAAIILSMLLKERLEDMNKKFVAKFKESGLVGH